MDSFSQPSKKICWKRSKIPIPYPEALEEMRKKTLAIHQGTAEEYVWLTEHPPLFTAGTSARAEDLINPHHYPTYEAGRGGQWTYHGPGQRVAYLMLDLTRPHGTIPERDVRAYVHGLEKWLKEALARLDIKSFTREGRIGLWCLDPQTQQEAKIAALGIRISRWVSWHGISLNVHPNLDDFNGIIPCGIRDYGVTSLARFNPDLTMEDADLALQQSWHAIFGTLPVIKPDAKY